MMNLCDHRLCSLFICLLVVFLFSTCEKESLASLIPEEFDGEANYVMNGQARTSPALISPDRPLSDCYVHINISDFSLGQPQASLIIDRVELCESIGDTLPVIIIGNESSQEPGLPIGRYRILNGGDILSASYGPSESPSRENYVVITSYDETTELIRASFKLYLLKSVGNDEDFPPTLDIEGTVEATL